MPAPSIQAQSLANRLLGRPVMRLPAATVSRSSPGWKPAEPAGQRGRQRCQKDTSPVSRSAVSRGRRRGVGGTVIPRSGLRGVLI